MSILPRKELTSKKIYIGLHRNVCKWLGRNIFIIEYAYYLQILEQYLSSNHYHQTMLTKLRKKTKKRWGGRWHEEQNTFGLCKYYKYQVLNMFINICIREVFPWQNKKKSPLK